MRPDRIVEFGWRKLRRCQASRLEMFHEILGYCRRRHRMIRSGRRGYQQDGRQSGQNCNILAPYAGLWTRRCPMPRKLYSCRSAFAICNAVTPWCGLLSLVRPFDRRTDSRPCLSSIAIHQMCGTMVSRPGPVKARPGFSSDRRAPDPVKERSLFSPDGLLSSRAMQPRRESSQSAGWEWRQWRSTSQPVRDHRVYVR